jgi:hypothetical protein
MESFQRRKQSFMRTHSCWVRSDTKSSSISWNLFQCLVCCTWYWPLSFWAYQRLMETMLLCINICEGQNLDTRKHIIAIHYLTECLLGNGLNWNWISKCFPSLNSSNENWKHQRLTLLFSFPILFMYSCVCVCVPANVHGLMSGRGCPQWL